MDTTQKLYLRGMTGEVYTGTAWEALPAAERAAWADDFYWLHADGFNALTSVSAAAELAAGTPAADMIVENLSACRERAYLPYALCAWEGLDDSLIGDASAPGTAGETLSYIPGSVPDWFTAQSALSVRQRGADVQAFLELEADYRAYAEANYLALPDEAAAAIGRALDLPAEKRTLSQIKDIILQTLESCLTYSESVVSYTGDTDFLTYALERSGSGYSVHYATAAALMLRYFRRGMSRGISSPPRKPGAMPPGSGSFSRRETLTPGRSIISTVSAGSRLKRRPATPMTRSSTPVPAPASRPSATTARPSPSRQRTTRPRISPKTAACSATSACRAM